MVDHTIILSTEAQSAFADRYTGLPWRVDLNEPAVFWFEREPAPTFRPYFIGSSSDASQTWLWGWDNISDFPDPVISLARHLREIGDQHGAVELTTAYQHLEPDQRALQELVIRAAPEHVYVFCAQAISDLAAPVYYRGPYGSGHSWFLLDNPAEFSLPAPTRLTTTSALTRALHTGYVGDHRLAVTAYIKRRQGLSLQETADGTLVVRTTDGDVGIAFDAHDRIVEIRS